MPRVGSAANVWTLLSTPDLTIKEPKIESRKVKIPKKTIQDNKILFLLNIKEWLNAVPASHGINATFSTGSQNQYPPQPSS